jgi:hypothetical protein
MNDITYANSDVIALLSASYIPVAVDAGEHPEIADLYHGANLPITVIFNAAGGEILHKEGWQRPRRMARLLQAVKPSRPTICCTGFILAILTSPRSSHLWLPR